MSPFLKVLEWNKNRRFEEHTFGLHLEPKIPIVYFPNEIQTCFPKGSLLGWTRTHEKKNFFESARTDPHVMEDSMYVDDTLTPSSGSVTEKRKRQSQAPNSPGT